MKFQSGTVVSIFAAAVVVTASTQSAQATAVFTDTFGSGSTVNAASPLPAPTATSTSYEIASTKNDTNPASTIASGDLSIKQVATTSGVTEVQALFAATPVTLSNAGDSIDMRLTFTPTTLGIAGDSDTLYFGLYNSGSPSSAPLTNLQNAGLSTATTSPTGGVGGWQV